MRDSDGQFIDASRTKGIKILKTPARTPVANTFSERCICALRRELLDLTIIWTNDCHSRTTRELALVEISLSPRIVRPKRSDRLINRHRNVA